MLTWSRIVVTAILLCVFANQHLAVTQADTIASSNGSLSSTGQNDSAHLPPRPQLDPDPDQTLKAVEIIHASNRKDILVWQAELSETQKYFNKLRVQNLNEEKVSQSADPVFRRWVEKTEERMTKLFGAMATRLSQLDAAA